MCTRSCAKYPAFAPTPRGSDSPAHAFVRAALSVIARAPWTSPPLQTLHRKTSCADRNLAWGSGHPYRAPARAPNPAWPFPGWLAATIGLTAPLYNWPPLLVLRTPRNWSPPPAPARPRLPGYFLA